MLYEYGMRTCDLSEAFIFFLSLVCAIFGAFLIKHIFHSRLLDIDDYSQLGAMHRVGYNHLMSNIRLWNNC